MLYFTKISHHKLTCYDLQVNKGISYLSLLDQLSFVVMKH